MPRAFTPSRSTMFVLLIVTMMLGGCSATPSKDLKSLAPETPKATLIESGVATAVGDMPVGEVKALAAIPQHPYRVQVGDVLDIKFLLNPEMNEQVSVLPDGTFSTAVGQNITAAGQELKDIQSDLKQRYGKHLKDPQLTVVVNSYVPYRIYVLGEVNSPGEFVTIGPNLTLLQSVARAGGLRNSARTSKLVIIRRDEKNVPRAYMADYDMAWSGSNPEADISLEPYDVVFVPRSDIGNVYLGYQQYIQQFLPISGSASYQFNN